MTVAATEHPGIYLLKNYVFTGKFSVDEVKNGLRFTEEAYRKFMLGQVDVDQSIAMKLEVLIPDIPASSWMKRQQKYNEEKLNKTT